MDTSGTLYICATPIGNLDDISIRALRILKEADLIAAEDTRNSIKLLNRFEIHTPMTSYHEHNKFEKARQIVGELSRGKNIALITDAGTPSISDPGEELVRQALDAGLRVVPVPGPAACIAAVSASGQAAGRFAFEGFLPREKKERAIVLEELRRETRAIVLYEAPHHLSDTLDDLYETLGDRPATVCRELTKLHEEIRKTTLENVRNYYKDNKPRGEYVLVIAGRDYGEILREEKNKWEGFTLSEHVAYYEADGISHKEAMRMAARDRGISRRDVYQALTGGPEPGIR